MKKMEKTVVCLLAGFLLSCTAYAQLKQEEVKGGFPFMYLGDLSNEDFFKQSDYIFEGKLISGKAFPNADTSKIWTSFQIRVTHVLKGKIDTGMIELILNSGAIFDSQDKGYALIAEYNNEYALNIPFDGVFFCKKTEFAFHPASGNPSVEPLQNKLNAILHYMPNQSDRNFALYGLNDLYFTDKEEFYQYASQYKGMNINKKKENTLNNLPDSLFYNPELDEFMAKQWERYYQIKQNKERVPVKKGIASTVELNISIQNQQITEGDVRYFEFDVCASTNEPGIYFCNMLARINFNTALFGTYLTTNGKVTISKGALFNSSTYEARVDDVSSSRLNIALAPPYGGFTPNYVYLPMVPITLLHVKIEIPSTSSTGYAGITFQEKDFTCIFSSYANFPTEVAPTSLFDITNYIDPEPFMVTISTTNPVIQSFTPNNIVAGAGEVLTISGNNFGTAKGSIRFNNADDGGNSQVVVDNTSVYIKSWSNTKVEVVVPSFALNSNGTKMSPAGSGNFEVVTSTSRTASSPLALTVNYSFLNARTPSTNVDQRLYLVNNNGINGMTFTLHSSLQNNTVAIQCIEKALCAWSGNLGIVLELEKDINDNYIFENTTLISGKNLIWINPNRPSAMAFNYIYDESLLSTEQPNGKFFKFITGKTDIEIAPVWDVNIPWDYRTSGTVPAGYGSFYNAFLHELGHILGLHHVNNPNALMYYTMNVYQSQPIINILNTGGTPIPAMERIFDDSYDIIFDAQCLAMGYSYISKEVPKIEYFAINNGDVATSSSNVTLNIKCRVCPTHYSVFDNIYAPQGWRLYLNYYESPGYKAYVNAYLTISLSIKVKNAAGESLVHTDDIRYLGGIFKNGVNIANESENMIPILNDADISVYPIPATNSVYLKISNDVPDTYSFILLDTKGMIIKQNKINSTETEIDISNLSNGIYIIRVIGNDKTFTKKIIKQ
jgi:hypothetical protein